MGLEIGDRAGARDRETGKEKGTAKGTGTEGNPSDPRRLRVSYSSVSEGMHPLTVSRRSCAAVGVGIAESTKHRWMRSTLPACRCLVIHSVRRHSCGSRGKATALAHSGRARYRMHRATYSLITADPHDHRAGGDTCGHGDEDRDRGVGSGEACHGQCPTSRSQCPETPSPTPTPDYYSRSLVEEVVAVP